jgi:LysM repeat protein
MKVKNAVLALAGLLTIGGGAVIVASYALGLIQAPATYVVEKGDTLFEIAVERGVTVDELRMWNQIDGDLIEIGQVLTIWPGNNEPEKAVRRMGTQSVKAAGSLIVAPSPKGRSMPAAKACVPPPTGEGLAEGAAMASDGLTYDQISSSMNAFIPNVLPCIPASGAAPAQTLELEVTVSCNGQVTRIDVSSRADWAPEVAECVIDTLGYAPFPAHDLPDGETFVYPLKFNR